MTATAQIDRGQVSSNPASTSEKSCIRFEIRDGIRRISCAVSDEALDAASGVTDGSTPGLRRRSFDRFRTLIHAAALMRLEARPPGCADSILLTSQDLQRVPPETGTPKFGSSASGSPVAPALVDTLAASHRELT